MTKVIITGSNGQLGSELYKQLTVSKTFEVIALSKQQLDVRNQHSVFQIIEKYQPDFVINCAAYTWVDEAEDNESLCYQVNEFGVKNLAQACDKNNAVLVQLSTDYVFDGELKRPYLESDPANPLNIYGKSKYAAEQVIAELCKKHIIIRTSSLFSLTGKNFCRSILKMAGKGKDLQVVSDQFSGLTYAPDLAVTIQTILSVIRAEENTFSDWGIYHYCGKQAVSWYDFALQVLQSQGYNEGQFTCEAVKSAKFNAKAKRPEYSMLDTSKIKTRFGVTPSDWLNAIYHNKFNI